MAKKFLFSLFLGISLLFSTLLSASGDISTTNIYTNPTSCELPAPDSFRITSTGGDFISLAWEPINPGALHTIVVLEEVGSGSWTNHSIFPSVGGDHFTVDGLDGGQKYRFIIATECSEGDPSTLTAIIDGITLIIDLALEGRMPTQPVIVNCQEIPLGYSWIGFSIQYLYEGISMENYFEVTETPKNIVNSNDAESIKIKRVNIIHPIMAVDVNGEWPQCDVPELPVGASFRVDRVISGGIDRERIGYIDIVKLPNPPRISMCPDYNNSELPWNNNYTFTSLISNKSTNLTLCNELFNKQNENSYNTKIIQNQDKISVYLSNLGDYSKSISVMIYNFYGSLITEKSLYFNGDNMEIQTSDLPKGFYFISL